MSDHNQEPAVVPLGRCVKHSSSKAHRKTKRCVGWAQIQVIDLMEALKKALRERQESK